MQFGLYMMNGKKAFILALLVTLLLRLLIFDFIIAQGHSMEPSIKDGNVLVINRLRYGVRIPWRQGQKYIIRWAQPKVGEVVVFYTPMGELAVKRCTALTEWGKFYAEGDNALSSYDSRSYGPVSVDNIIGKVLGY
jgi:signal peptidase I